MSRTQKLDCAKTIKALQLDQDVSSQVQFPSAQKSKLCEKIPVCKSFLSEFERRSREINIANRWMQDTNARKLLYVPEEYKAKAQDFIQQECKKEYPKADKQSAHCIRNLEKLAGPAIGVVTGFMSDQELELRKFVETAGKCKKAVGLSK